MDLIERAADHLAKKGVGEKDIEPAHFPGSLPSDHGEEPWPAQETIVAAQAYLEDQEPQQDSAGVVPDHVVPEPQPAVRNGVGTGRDVALDLEVMRKNNVLLPFGQSTQLTEEFRHIKRDVLGLTSVEGLAHSNMIMVTSAAPGEGKTHTAVNLAMSIASERDLTVLLIDADFTRPRVLERLGVTANKGLIDLLVDPSLDVSDVLLRTDIDTLSVLPAGPNHHRSTELLASRRMHDLADEIANRYSDRIIIFDTAPLLATTEPAILVRHVGQILVVVEAEKTSKGALSSAVDIIKDHKGIGFVLNKMKPQLGQSLVGGHYNYYNYGYQNKE